VPLRPTALFYLGLFPIVILLWAWADSVTMNTVWGRKGQDGRTLHIGLANSCLRVGFITRIPDPAVAPSPPGRFQGELTRFSLARVTRRGEPIPIFPALRWENGPRPGAGPSFDFRMVHLPFWLIFAAYLPLWLGLSYWRSSRIKKRIQQSLPPAQPQTDFEN
jgi:hypothetical protein